MAHFNLFYAYNMPSKIEHVLRLKRSQHHENLSKVIWLCDLDYHKNLFIWNKRLKRGFGGCRHEFGGCDRLDGLGGFSGLGGFGGFGGFDRFSGFGRFGGFVF